MSCHVRVACEASSSYRRLQSVELSMVLKKSLRDHGQALCPSPQIPAKDALLYRKPLHLASTTVLHNNKMGLGLKHVNCGDYVNLHRDLKKKKMYFAHYGPKKL